MRGQSSHLINRPMGEGSSSAPCAIHKTHTPAPTYTEMHHVIPQAWQVHWQPPQPWPNQGPSPDRYVNSHPYMLWDGRTVALCRTGHGNVHYWLVEVMREIALLAKEGSGDADASTTWAKAATTIRIEARAKSIPHVVGVDLGWALEAIDRYSGAGGSIADLIAHGLWGEI